MYTFTDRGGESVTLRPEATAGVCRALVSNGLTQSLPQKVFYTGPMFRYERPQKGRYRQFHQIDVELIGSAEPLADAEVIACGWDILQALGVAGDTVLELNTLGDRESRDAYRAALVALFRRASRRAERGQPGAAGAQPAAHPRQQGRRATRRSSPTRRPSTRYLTDAARAFYDGVKQPPDAVRRAVRENPRIVRGLDYYSHTAFEFVTTALGAQGTVMGGGRYDGLVEEMGGPPTPGDRLGGRRRAARACCSPAPPAAPAPVAVIPVGDGGGGGGARRAAGAAPRRHPRGDGVSRQSQAPAWSAPTAAARAPP